MHPKNASPYTKSVIKRGPQVVPMLMHDEILHDGPSNAMLQSATPTGLGYSLCSLLSMVSGLCAYQTVVLYT